MDNDEVAHNTNVFNIKKKFNANQPRKNSDKKVPYYLTYGVSLLCEG